MTITDQKFYLPGGLTNGQGSLPVAITARIWQSGRLLMSNLIPVKLFQNLTSSFGEQDFFALNRYEFLHVCIVQKAPIHYSHIYRLIKILQTVLEKGHPRTIPVKLFQNLTSSFGEEDFLRLSSCPYSARKPDSPEPCL